MAATGLPTIREVARLAGVSVATVSKALNGSGHVSEPLKVRVRSAAESLGYAPHASARSLRSGATRILGLLVADITNPFFLHLVETIERLASAAGYSVILCNSAENPEHEKRNLQMLLSQRVDGIVLMPTRESWPGRVGVLSNLTMPRLLVDRLLDGLETDSVTIDNTLAGRLAAEHLLALGHRRVGLIMGSPEHQIARHRLDGFRDAFAAAGAPIEARFLEKNAFDEAGARAAAHRLLGAPERPSAIFATNNHLALGLLGAIAETAIEVPREVSVITIDDLPWARIMRPGLTVVMQPTAAIADAAVTMLLGRIAAPEAAAADDHTAIVLKPYLLERGSTGPAEAAA